MSKIFIVILVLAIVALGAYFLGKSGLTVSFSKPIATSPIVSSPAATQKAVEVSDEVALLKIIKNALVAKHGPDANELNITVSKIQGNYAQGGAAATGGGAMWLAVKAGGVWKLVWDGNGTISCSLTNQYPDFPTTMIPECWDEATLKSVTR